MSTLPPARSRVRPNAVERLAQCLGPIEYRPVAELRTYARNPRKHPKAQVDKLVASIREFGFMMPVLASREGEIIAGEARVAAAREVGLTVLPVIAVEHLSAVQIRAYRIVDNQLATQSDWDFEILAEEVEGLLSADFSDISILGWETGELDVILDKTEAGEGSAEERVPEPPLVPVSQEGDLWRLGAHRVLCGSSLVAASWDRLMDGRRAALCFSDPPFNVPIQGHVCGSGAVRHAEFAMASGEMSEGEFIAFLTQALEQMSARVVDGAVFQICMDWRHLYELQTAARAIGLTMLNLCVWNKTNAGMGSLYRSKHELVLILKKGAAAHVNNVLLGKHGRNRTNVWDYPGVNGFGKARMSDLAAHPTVKPLALVADAIKDVTRRGDIVIDGFLGSGTVILAAEQTGRVGCGIEIEPGYVDVAIRRWEEMSGKQAVLEGDGRSFAAVAAARATQGGAIGD